MVQIIPDVFMYVHSVCVYMVSSAVCGESIMLTCVYMVKISASNCGLLWPKFVVHLEL